MGTIENICVSRRKGTVKKSVEKAEIKSNWGIVGDAHAGNWHRQVSLLAGESIDRMKNILPALTPGAFAENIVTRGFYLHRLKIGDHLLLAGSALLKVTQIGKECHKACAIKTQTGDCIMPKKGIFARVLQGGSIKIGDSIELVSITKEECIQVTDH
ncbi:MAG TPA: MOSC domain-containing protein [Bacteroidetes bacterium]|nr:MOSC domain-containing protein [Bacteroidota bacterium]